MLLDIEVAKLLTPFARRHMKTMSGRKTRKRIVATSTPAELNAIMHAEARRWGDIIRTYDIKPD